ncbi:MAG: glycosyltransferase family 4 protein [Pseudomonadota bacterium]
MTPQAAAFAIPGDINTVTGGYIYERRLLESLREIGHDVQHIELGASFPDPTEGDMAEAIERLMALPKDRALILDGLVYGSIDTAGLARVAAPIVAMIHHPLALETGLTPSQQDHLFRTERDNLALAAQVLVPSPHTAHILISRYDVPADKITIAPPGSDRKPAIRSPQSPPLIIAVGILHPRKGHDTLITALGELRDLPWQAVIAGGAHDPEHAELLKGMVEDLGLADRITLPGRLTDDELDAQYKRASIFALATRYEGYGMVFDEALLWGLPIVSCAAGAVTDTVPPNAGVLVPPADPDALADALARVLRDVDVRSRMEEASAEAGRARPSWRDTATIAGQVLNTLGR